MFDENNRFEKWYRKFRKHFSFVFKINSIIGTILLILLILLLVLEFSSFIIIKIVLLTHDGYYSHLSGNDVYKENKDWILEFKKESVLIKGAYHPYIDHITQDTFKGKYINLINNSRYTYNPCKNDNSIKIFVFGGSTTWGADVRDNSTIPSFISKKLCEKGIGVDVTNFGELGYVNTQEMIKLMLKLREGNIPNYVIFYDGINDVGAAYDNNEAGLTSGTPILKQQFNSRRDFNILTPILYNTNLGRIIRERLDFYKNENKLEVAKNKKLSNDIINIYYENIKIINSLAEVYNFTVYYFWQPIIFTKKHLSPNEREIMEKEDIILKNLYLKTYSEIRAIKNPLSNFYNLDNVFDNNTKSIYGDFVHVSESGNEIIAENIVNILLPDLNKYTSEID